MHPRRGPEDVLIAHLLQLLMEGQIVPPEEVLRAAGQEEPGRPALLQGPLRHVHRVLHGALQPVRRAEDGIVILQGHPRQVILLDPAGDDVLRDQGGGHGNHAAEDLRIADAVEDGAEAAHAEPRQHRVLPPVGQVEHPPGHVHQLLADEPAVVLPQGFHVHIEMVAAVGHDDRAAVPRRPQGDAGLGQVVQAAAGIAVQQVHRGIGALRIGRDHRAFRRRIQGDHRGKGAVAHGGEGIVFTFKEGHGIFFLSGKHFRGRAMAALRLWPSRPAAAAEEPGRLSFPGRERSGGAFPAAGFRSSDRGGPGRRRHAFGCR